MAGAPSFAKFKLLDEVRQAIRARHYSPKTEESYVHWIKRFIFFHDKRHPAQMGEKEIGQFLSGLATDRHVSASTQNQALNAILFLYRDVLRKEIGYVDGGVRAKRPHRLPVVLTRQEVKSILGALDHSDWLMVMLLYGAGLRLMECLQLRVKDIDFITNQIVVRAGKGDKDRHTMLPALSNDRILKVEIGEVTLSYRDRKDGDRKKTMTLGAHEFIRRFPLHVLPDGLMRIRHFGFLANRSKKQALSQCRKLLDLDPALPQSPILSAKDLLLKITGIDLSRCPCCHEETMIIVGDLPPSSSLPPWDSS
jgi:integrase